MGENTYGLDITIKFLTKELLPPTRKKNIIFYIFERRTMNRSDKYFLLKVLGQNIHRQLLRTFLSSKYCVLIFVTIWLSTIISRFTTKLCRAEG